MSCLNANSFSGIDPYHNDVGINTINELVADLHRHEDFIGTNRSNILGTTANSITSQLISFNSGKNAIVAALSSIANNLIGLIDVEVDEYSWCDSDESEYSGPRTISNYPEGIFDHWNWPSIIDGIINILQNLLCICAVEIELPPGEDIIFREGIVFGTQPTFPTVPAEWLTTQVVQTSNTSAHSNFLSSENNCGTGPSSVFFGGPTAIPHYRKAFFKNNLIDSCNDIEGQYEYRSAIRKNHLFAKMFWQNIDDGTYAQPEDIPFELIKSELIIQTAYHVGTLTNNRTDLTDTNLSMNAEIEINNKIFFKGEISINDSVFFPDGPPTKSTADLDPYMGARITTNNWGDLLPSDFLLHSGQDTAKISWNHSTLPFLNSPIPDIIPEGAISNYFTSKAIGIRSLVLTIKARRPA